MGLTKDIRYKLFKFTWYLFVLGTICDITISKNFNIGAFNLNIQFSSVSVIIFLTAFLFIFPFRELKGILKNKFYKVNFIIFSVLLVIAFISSYFSVFQKFTLTNTVSRYTLYLISLFVTVLYLKYFEKAGEFILKSFIYSNFLIVLSIFADYYIPGFHQILVDKFGHMELIHSNLKTGNNVYLRPSGFVTDTNLTALTIGFSSILLLLNRNKFNKYFEYLFYGLAGYCFGMTSSRSALIFVLILYIVILIKKPVSRKISAVFFVLFFAFQFLTPQTRARILQLTDSKYTIEEMGVGRPLIWKADFIAMKIKPMTGLGSGAFFVLSEIFIARVKNDINDELLKISVSDPETKPVQGINPHNIFFTMQIEHGIAGTILFVILVLYNLFYFYKSRKYFSFTAAVGLIFVSSLSNYAPYYKYYLLIIIVFFVLSLSDMKFSDEIQKH